MLTRSLPALCCLTLLSLLAVAQEPAQFDADYGKPGPEHKRLAALEGKWELTMEDTPGVKGTAEFKSIFGGRFVTEQVKLPFGGESMEWLGIYGYDANKKKFTATWVDNFDTTTETGLAPPDEAEGVFSFHGSHPDPRTGEAAAFIWRITLTGKDKLTVEMFETDEGGNQQKVMAISGKRTG